MRFSIIGAALALTLAALPASAAERRSPLEPADPPDEGDAIALDVTGGLPEISAESWFRFDGKLTVRNVSQPTLTPVLPASGTATGAAVIVAPGGAFMMLSMENEGWPVAQWLADRGIAAFLLKYRLEPTPPDLQDFLKALGARFAGAPGGEKLRASVQPALADARAALRLVRTRADEWGVDPRRVGFLGASAGAMTGLGLVLEAQADAMPDFLGLLYGPMDAVEITKQAPPLFVAMAADDPLFARKGYGLIESWQRLRRPVELHVYQRGGHGFGMGVPGTTSADWLPAFHRWIETNGWIASEPVLTRTGRLITP